LPSEESTTLKGVEGGTEVTAIRKAKTAGEVNGEEEGP